MTAPAPIGTILAMTTPPATARFLLFPQVGDDVSDAKSVKIRRFRLTRLDINPPAGGTGNAFDHLKQSHD